MEQRYVGKGIIVTGAGSGIGRGVAERLGAREILTTDRRHFSAVRTERNRLVSLVP